jgi:crotonobetainyl-CoA:carnitine CoA-transferase CaiB-like acyl-CoA transferase
METDTTMTAHTPGAGSLQGLTVIEMSTSVAGPMTGQILGDLGADVIKLERVGRGDDTRNWAPPYWNGVSTAFLGLNRNKKSLELDFKDPRGLEILEELLRGADVLVQNLRPGALEKAGLSWDRLRELNPRLVYCDITGYGPEGPRAQDPAYDPLLQAYTGIVSMMPTTDSGPARVPLSILDKGTAHWAVIGIMEALRHRDLTGEGRHVGVSLLHTALEWVSGGLMSTRAGSPPHGNLGSGHPGVVPYGAFPASDGHIFISAGNQTLWTRLLNAVEAPELDAREGFGSNPGRAARREEVNTALSEVTSRFDRAELMRRLTSAGVPNAPVRTLPEVLEDPQVAAVDALATLPHPKIDDLEVVNLPIRFDGACPPHRSAPPLLGADTLDVLATAGVGPDEARALLAAGVVGATEAPAPKGGNR